MTLYAHGFPGSKAFIKRPGGGCKQTPQRPDDERAGYPNKIQRPSPSSLHARARALVVLSRWVSAVYATVSPTPITRPPACSTRLRYNLSIHHPQMTIDPKRHAPNRGDAWSTLKKYGPSRHRHAALRNFQPPDHNHHDPRHGADIISYS